MTYADKLFNKVPFIRKTLNDDSCQKIYHYTKPAKLLLILQNEYFRFSNALYLNDKEEITYSYQLIYDILEELDNINFEVKEKIQTHFKNRINHSTIETDYQYNFEYYTCSFSTEADNLTLWNNYTKDKNYTGYNIGFDKIKLINGMLSRELYPIYGKIIYDRKKQTSIVKTVIERWNYKFEKALKLKNTEKTQTKLFNILIELTDILSLISIFFKNPHFKNEQEYRIVIINNLSSKNAKPTKICEKHGLFVPFIECEFSKDTVSEINIGPTLNEHIFVNSTHRMLLNYGYNATEIKQSKIPLRY